MQISITDSAAFDIYKKYQNILVFGEEPTKEKPFTFEVDEIGKGTPSERLDQYFAFEAIQDGDTTLSLVEAKKIDQYYQSTHPTLRALFRFDLPSAPLDDPELETALGLTSLGDLEYLASRLSGQGAKEDLLAAIAQHPKLAIFLHPSHPENFVWLSNMIALLGDNSAYRKFFLDQTGEVADAQNIFEPMAFCLEKNRVGFLTIMRGIIDAVSYSQWKNEPDYQLKLHDRNSVLELSNDPNSLIVGDALVSNARMRFDKSIILRAVADARDYSVYNKALESLAIWGDQESIAVLVNIVRYGGFQQYIMAQAAMRNHLSIDQLAAISRSFLEDNDPFVRGAGLKIVQFIWQKDGFAAYQDYFLGEVKHLAATDPNKFVRMSAIECLGYSHDSELMAWLDTINESPDLDPFIKAAYKHTANKEIPSGYDNNIDFLSDSYAFPIQYKWITQTLKKLAGEGRKKLKVLFTGASFGPEATSLIMEVMKDYEADPLAWNGFNPARDLKIIVSDIEPQVLLYAERGHYYAGREEANNEYFGMMLYHRVYGEDFSRVLDHFFRPIPNREQCASQFKMKDQYAKMLEFRYLDVTTPPSEPIADIVTFNRLDYLWENSPGATFHVVQQVFALSSAYVAYVNWQNHWTLIALSEYGEIVHKSGPMGFMRKR